MLGQLGAGPSLTRRVAYSHAKDDWKEISTVINASIAVSLTMALIIGMISIVAISTGELPQLLSQRENYPNNFTQSLYVAVGMSLVSLVASPFMRAQIGIHETYINNICGAIGSGVGLLLLVVVLPFIKSLPVALLAYCSPPLVGSTLSACIFLTKHRKKCKISSNITLGEMKLALSDGLSFTVFEAGQALSREGIKIFIMKNSGASNLAGYGGIVQIAMIGRAFFLLVGIPSLAYVSDLMAKNEISKCRRILFGVAKIGITAAVLVPFIGYYLGWLPFSILFSQLPTPSNFSMMAGAFFGIAICYKSAMMLYTTALGKTWAAAIASLVEAVLIGGMLWILGNATSTSALFTQGIVIAIISGVILTIYSLKCLNEQQENYSLIKNPT